MRAQYLVMDRQIHWSVHTEQQVKQSGHTSLATMPQQLSTVSDVGETLQFLQSYHVCTGNEDENYFILQAARKGIFMDFTGN